MGENGEEGQKREREREREGAQWGALMTSEIGEEMGNRRRGSTILDAKPVGQSSALPREHHSCHGSVEPQRFLLIVARGR